MALYLILRFTCT